MPSHLEQAAMSDVAVALDTSRQAHRRYRAAAGSVDASGRSTERDMRACGDAVLDALRARAEAEHLDPDKTDPAWAEDAVIMRASHEALIQHYLHYLGIPIEELV